MNNNQTKVEIRKNGPVVIKGNLRITDHTKGETISKQQISVCRCGISKEMPYCDGAHKSHSFD